MDTHGSQHASPNGHEHPADGGASQPPQPRFIEDETGATLDSGATVCRFNPIRGGRMEMWQWRTVPPPDAGSPHARHKPPSIIDLVDPTRGALIDHFFPLGAKPQEVAEHQEREFGDFVEGPFRSQVVDSGGEIRIGLLRDGQISAGKRVADVRLAKSAAVRPGAADVSVLYRVINSSLRPLQILFAVEFNLYAPGLKAGQEGYYLIDGVRPDDSSLGSMGVSPNATHVALANPTGEMGLQLGWDREADLWRMPAEDGANGVRLLSVWRITLPPRDNWAMGLWMAPG